MGMKERAFALKVSVSLEDLVPGCFWVRYSSSVGGEIISFADQFNLLATFEVMPPSVLMSLAKFFSTD